MSARLDVCLEDGEQWACLEVAHKGHVTLAPGVVQCWVFWIVPLAMDLIPFLPWLQQVQPAIDWGLYHVLQEQHGTAVDLFGHGCG